MPWFKVDDKLHDKAAARAAGTQAMGLWVLAGSWCGDNLTDGFVPESVANRWDRRYDSLASRLVAAGLWEVFEKDGEPGWRFVDWEKFNPTKEQVLAKRQAAKERMEKARRSRPVRANKRDTFATGSPNPDPTRPPFLTEGEGSERCETCDGTGWVVNDTRTATACPKCRPHLQVVKPIELEKGKSA